MAFFKKLPDLLYASKITKSGFGDYTRIKNMFRVYKLSDNAKRHALQFYKYTIPEGARPEDVAMDVYDRTDFHWIVLMVNEIVDVYEQWPKDRQTLEKLVTDKVADGQYAPPTFEGDPIGPATPDSTHHLETLERTDSDGNVVIPAGLTVSDDWSYTYRHSTSPSIEKTLLASTDTAAISNFDYEDSLNEKKRTIELLKPEYVQTFIQDFENITSYEQNSDLEDKRTKKTAIDLVRKYY